jgi:hypothetical protein
VGLNRMMMMMIIIIIIIIIIINSIPSDIPVQYAKE